LVISKSSPLDFLGFNDTLLLSVHPRPMGYISFFTKENVPW
jgi:hypothetical protein